MPAFYQFCDARVADMAGDLIAKYHSAFLKTKLRIDYVFARSLPDANGEPGGPALKLHGYVCAGICKVISAKDRALGRGDVEICLDADQWDKMDADEQAALLDHELEHIDIQFDKDNRAIPDIYGRPVVKMKLHDRQFGWFDCIARRHGRASGEVQQATALCKSASETYFQEAFPFSAAA